MVGDLGESLWLGEITDSVHREKRPLGHIILVILVVTLINNTFHLQLYQLHSVSMVNTTPHKTIQLTNPYLAITNDEQNYACQRDL